MPNSQTDNAADVSSDEKSFFDSSFLMISDKTFYKEFRLLSDTSYFYIAKNFSHSSWLYRGCKPSIAGVSFAHHLSREYQEGNSDPFMRGMMRGALDTTLLYTVPIDYKPALIISKGADALRIHLEGSERYQTALADYNQRPRRFDFEHAGYLKNLDQHESALRVASQEFSASSSAVPWSICSLIQASTRGIQFSFEANRHAETVLSSHGGSASSFGMSSADAAQALQEYRQENPQASAQISLRYSDVMSHLSLSAFSLTTALADFPMAVWRLGASIGQRQALQELYNDRVGSEIDRRPILLLHDVSLVIGAPNSFLDYCQNFIVHDCYDKNCRAEDIIRTYGNNYAYESTAAAAEALKSYRAENPGVRERVPDKLPQTSPPPMLQNPQTSAPSLQLNQSLEDSLSDDLRPCPTDFQGNPLNLEFLARRDGRRSRDEKSSGGSPEINVKLSPSRTVPLLFVGSIDTADIAAGKLFTASAWSFNVHVGVIAIAILGYNERDRLQKSGRDKRFRKKEMSKRSGEWKKAEAERNHFQENILGKLESGETDDVDSAIKALTALESSEREKLRLIQKSIHRPENKGRELSKEDCQPIIDAYNDKLAENGEIMKELLTRKLLEEQNSKLTHLQDSAKLQEEKRRVFGETLDAGTLCREDFEAELDDLKRSSAGFKMEWEKFINIVEKKIPELKKQCAALRKEIDALKGTKKEKNAAVLQAQLLQYESEIEVRESLAKEGKNQVTACLEWDKTFLPKAQAVFQAKEDLRSNQGAIGSLNASYQRTQELMNQASAACQDFQDSLDIADGRSLCLKAKEHLELLHKTIAAEEKEQADRKQLQESLTPAERETQKACFFQSEKDDEQRLKDFKAQYLAVPEQVFYSEEGKSVDARDFYHLCLDDELMKEKNPELFYYSVESSLALLDWRTAKERSNQAVSCLPNEPAVRRLAGTIASYELEFLRLSLQKVFVPLISKTLSWVFSNTQGGKTQEDPFPSLVFDSLSKLALARPIFDWLADWCLPNQYRVERDNRARNISPDSANFSVPASFVDRFTVLSGLSVFSIGLQGFQRCLKLEEENRRRVFYLQQGTSLLRDVYILKSWGTAAETFSVPNLASWQTYMRIANSTGSFVGTLERTYDFYYGNRYARRSRLLAACDALARVSGGLSMSSFVGIEPDTFFLVPSAIDDFVAPYVLRGAQSFLFSVGSPLNNLLQGAKALEANPWVKAGSLALQAVYHYSDSNIQRALLAASQEYQAQNYEDARNCLEEAVSYGVSTGEEACLTLFLRLLNLEIVLTKLAPEADNIAVFNSALSIIQQAQASENLDKSQQLTKLPLKTLFADKKIQLLWLKSADYLKKMESLEREAEKEAQKRLAKEQLSSVTALLNDRVSSTVDERERSRLLMLRQKNYRRISSLKTEDSERALKSAQKDLEAVSENTPYWVEARKELAFLALRQGQYHSARRFFHNAHDSLRKDISEIESIDPNKRSDEQCSSLDGLSKNADICRALGLFYCEAETYRETISKEQRAMVSESQHGREVGDARCDAQLKRLTSAIENLDDFLNNAESVDFLSHFFLEGVVKKLGLEKERAFLAVARDRYSEAENHFAAAKDSLQNTIGIIKSKFSSQGEISGEGMQILESLTKERQFCECFTDYSKSEGLFKDLFETQAEFQRKFNRGDLILRDQLRSQSEKVDVIRGLFDRFKTEARDLPPYQHFLDQISAKEIFLGHVTAFCAVLGFIPENPRGRHGFFVAHRPREAFPRNTERLVGLIAQPGGR